MSSHVPFWNLPPELQAQLDAELRPGERLLWAGQPSAKRMARMGYLTALFGLPPLGFAIFWTATAAFMMWRAQAPLVFRVLFPLVGLPFIGVGLYTCMQPARLAARARRTWYAVTDRRCIVSVPTSGGGFAIRNFGPDRLQRLVRRVTADGSGDLLFDPDPGLSGPLWAGLKPAARLPGAQAGFLGIENVKFVEELIERALVEPWRRRTDQGSA